MVYNIRFGKIKGLENYSLRQVQVVVVFEKKYILPRFPNSIMLKFGFESLFYIYHLLESKFDKVLEKCIE